MINRELVLPVLKWAGGKRQILNEIRKHSPGRFLVYHEPFVGGGAVFFDLQPSKAVINDVNAELINVYRIIKLNVDELIESLSRHKNEKDYFYRIRRLDRDKKAYSRLTPVQRASRTIFLNKTCFNGLFRVNSAGQFNTPFGQYKSVDFINEKVLRAVSAYFNESDIRFTCQDFELALECTRKGDFVYLDPPYDPITNTASFTGYSRMGFNRREQVRLKSVCDNLHKKGVMFLLSNSATDFVMDLYEDYRITTIQARRVVNSRGDGRGKVDEVLVTNFVP